MAPREERVKRQNELLALHPAVKQELMKIPGVSHVAIGLKEINNELTDEIVFQVFVDKKLDEKELESGLIIPKEINGIKTDVRLTHYGAVPRGFFDPGLKGDMAPYIRLKGGIMVGWGMGGGTLGCFGRLVKDNALVILTNHHVIASDREEGDPVGQPQYHRACCCCCAYDEFKIGVLLKKGCRTDKVDAALGKVDNGIGYDVKLENSVSLKRGISLRIEGTSTSLTSGDRVQKIGRISGHTWGIVDTINAEIPPGELQEKKMIHQITIKPAPEETFIETTNRKRAFSDGGDSGSVILNEKSEIVALMHGGNPDRDVVDITYASHIQDVLDALKDDGLEMIIEKSPPKGSLIEQAPEGRSIDKQVRPATDIKEKLLHYEQGKLLLNLFDTHHQEILALLNHERQVTVTWQRNQGPAFVAHLVKSAQDPLYIIPEAVESISLQHLMIKMISVLKAKGSKALQEAIEKYGVDVIEYSSGLNTVNEIFNKLNERALA